VKTKDSLFGPYSSLWSQLSVAGNSLGYTYSDVGESNIMVNGNDVGDGSTGVVVSNNGRYAFCYFEDKKGYCNVDGKVYGPYGTGMGAIVSDKHFIIKYEDKLEDGGKKYIIIDDKEYGPYDYISSFEVSNDLFAFAYDTEDNSFMNIDGNVYGPYDKSGALANLVLDEDNYAYSYRDDLNWITIVNEDVLDCPQGNQVSSINFYKDDFIFSCSTSLSNYVFIKSEDIDLDDVIDQEGEEDFEENLKQCSGCLVDDKCYPLGYRKDGGFCSPIGEFVPQLEGDSSCENNFECISNLCIDDECIKPGLFRRILNWFKRLFGLD